jgi:hypothetical protein
VATIPSFRTPISALLPAPSVHGGQGIFGSTPGTPAIMVNTLGYVIHIVEANRLVPLITQRQVELPPVLTMMSILVVGRLFGATGLPVAVPLLAAGMVLVRRLLVNRIYEAQGIQRLSGDRVLVLRVPATDGGVIVSADPPIDVLRFAEPAWRTA